MKRTLFLLVLISAHVARTMEPGKQVLIIGANPNVLEQLSAELQKRGFTVEASADYEDVAAIKQTYAGKRFDVIAFGRALTTENKTILKDYFKLLNPAIAFVEGLAPITNLLADQVELAVNDDLRGVIILRLDKKQVYLKLRDIQADEISVQFYHLNWMYKSSEELLYSGPEKHPLSVRLPKTSGQLFLTIRVNNSVVSVGKIPEWSKQDH